MIIEMFLALPLFTEDKQPFIKDIRVEFIPSASRFCTDKGNNPFNLKCKILTMIDMNPTPGDNKQHRYYSDCIRKKYPIQPGM